MKYIITSASRNRQIEPAPEQFWDAFVVTLMHWEEYIADGAKFSVPENNLATAASGAMTGMQVTFSGDWTHYGYNYYGCSIH